MSETRCAPSIYSEGAFLIKALFEQHAESMADSHHPKISVHGLHDNTELFDIV